ncbi:MAG: helix-turn-helix domain-containing protein [Humibacillus sp.]
MSRQPPDDLEQPQPPPGHPLADRLVLTRAEQVRSLAHPLRTTILGLLTERAATVSELAEAVGRPKGTVAHHVGVLHDAGLLQVVRTRRVRAVEERYWGRAARTVTISVAGAGDTLPLDFNDFEVAAAESREAYEAHELWAFLRHARLTPEQVQSVWERLRDVVEELDRLPRTGEVTYGVAVGLYPVRDAPRLPDPPNR